MDNFNILDLRYENEVVSIPLQKTSITREDPLDLRTEKASRKLGPVTAPYSNDFVEHARPSVIIANAQFSISQRSRWNRRSHPSIDSDSSFESELESDGTRCSLDGFTRRESVTTDTDSEAPDSNSPPSKGFFKDLPANVPIDEERRASVKRILNLSECQAEVLDPEDVQSELKSDVSVAISSYEEDSDDTNESCLQINETETYLEELLKMESGQRNNSSEFTDCVRAGIQETASKFITEIRKTKSDTSPALNLVVDGNKKHRCMKCSEEFCSVAALLKHLMMHSSRNPGEKLIKCPVCVKRFSTLTTLEIHIHRFHVGELKYVCQTCEIPFKFSTHLRRHVLNTRCGKGTKKNP